MWGHSQPPIILCWEKLVRFQHVAIVFAIWHIFSKTTQTLQSFAIFIFSLYFVEKLNWIMASNTICKYMLYELDVSASWCLTVQYQSWSLFSKDKKYMHRPRWMWRPWTCTSISHLRVTQLINKKARGWMFHTTYELTWV